MDGRPTWTDCDEAGDYVVPNALSPRDIVSRPDNVDETVPHIFLIFAQNESPTIYVLEQKQEKYIYPSKPHFFYIKVACKGVLFYTDMLS